ncbi:MAG: class I SAM-dependent methyltransferase [Planctomycetaceae bacterium]|nr:class I SAM-dependent methyltransferase [Planctomycetaceae bacterium]
MPTGSLYDWPIHEIATSDMAALSGRPAACPICRVADSQPRFWIEGLPHVIWTCPQCGLGWMHPLPTDAELATFYPPTYYGADGSKFRGWIEWAVRLVGARHLRFLTRHLPPGAAVLDVGCGRGVLLRELANRGFRAFGTERSVEACAGADPRAEIRVCDRLSLAGFDAGSFDQIIVWHVLEHLIDPLETVSEIHRLLKPGGTAVIAVPNFSSWQARWSGAAWFHLDPPRHIFHFSMPALERMLTDAGLPVRSRHHFSLRQNPFGWVQSALNRGTGLPRNGLYDWLLRRDHYHADLVGHRLAYPYAFLLGMPAATALEVLASLCRNGATVHVVAVKRETN